MSSLSLTQISRALAASVALDCPPPKPWLDAYMLRFRSQLSELNPEGLVDVLRALSKAGALPSYDWLVDMEKDVERRQADMITDDQCSSFCGIVVLIFLDIQSVCQAVLLLNC